VGTVTEGALSGIGIHRIGQLAEAPEALLAGAIGLNQARDLRELARGVDPREVIPDAEARSVGAEETFERDLHGPEALLPRLREQAERVAAHLRRAGRRGRTVTLKLKYADFESITRRVTLAVATDDGHAIYEAAAAQLARADTDRAVRLTGVSVSGFDGGAEQLGLFDAARREEPRRARLNEALDRIAGRHGAGAVRPASTRGEEDDSTRR
jgi:DNA polymerase-4